MRKPIDDLTIKFEKLRNDKKFLAERDYYYNNWVHKGPTPFIKLQNLTNHLGGAQIYAKVVSAARGGAHKIYGAITAAMLCKKMNKRYLVTTRVPVIMVKCFLLQQNISASNVKFLWGIETFRDKSQT